MNQTNDLQGES